MIFFMYILVGESLLCFIVDLLCLIKLLLGLVNLYASIFLSSFALHIGVAIGICSIFMPSQCIKQNLQLSRFSFLILFYPTHCFTLCIVFFVCKLHDDVRPFLSFFFFLIEHSCVLCKLLYESLGRFMLCFVTKFPKEEIVRTLSLICMLVILFQVNCDLRNLFR